MAKNEVLTVDERRAQHKEGQKKYRLRIHRFTLQFSLSDTVAFEWLSAKENKGA